VIALDTNILVHAHRRGTAHHEPALALLESLSQGPAPYALFWPSLYEFFWVVTHRRVFDPPSTTLEALEAIQDLLAPPVVRVLSESDRHPAAHLVALALEHGVREILTLDGDFARFPQVSSRNPFL